ncbi:cilia- and flagella-associated protein 70-like, partial [Anoplophora glabripennis]|uniref:cilia- and flagella-associated protein 70-like n=1 Tax=Anoplophora glabripennis TaxID=217634 RepID=UPI000C776273
MEKTRRKESHQVMKKEHGEGKTEESIQEYKDETKDENEVKEKDMRTVTITLDYYQNIIPLHPTADIQTRCKYLDRNLGETSLLPITDEPTLPINETFTFKININCKKDSDHLISSPALLTVLQFAGTCDPGLYEQLQLCENTKHVGSAKSFESIVSIYEALTGDTVDRDIVDAAETKAVARMKKMEKKKEKKSAANKSSKPTKSPKATSKKQKQKISESTSVDSLSLDAKPTTYGMCVIDFLPLFYGKSSFTETLMINPVELFYDERMITYKIRPKITVTVSIDKEICFPHTTILNFTVESLFNIPSVMKPDMDYKICAMLPMENSVQFLSKIRVASPLTTFNFHEALKETGITDSYFVPKPREPEVTEEVVVPEPEVPKNDKKPEKSKKKEKSSASKYSKSTKKDSKRLSQAKSDLQQLLPLPPEPVPEPEPSTPVYSENGKPTFITVEIELSQPIFKKRDVEDLENELQSLLEDKKDSSHKVVLTQHVSKDYYKAVLNQITKDIYDKYKQYTSLKEKESSTVAEKDFIKYLESVGAYQTYLTSIKEAISVVITTKFHINETDKKNSHLYQNFIGEVFVYLVSEMNDTLNRLVCTGLQPVVTPKPKPADKLYFYAKEAAALGKRELADRYYLEIICYNELQNPDSWFDYAVFNLEIKQPDRAYECVLIALEKQRSHRYSLLLLGIMLADKGQRNEAETCFLNLLVYQPRWVEGWVSLFLFYKKIDIYEGMDMAMDMVKKYLDDERTTSDYFSEMEDLLWTSKICPKTMFFRTAVLLLKMRVYEWVEMALVQEVQRHFGITHYLLSAVCLYQELYEQALEHIQLTKAYCGPDYAVSSLSGHCLYALSRLPEAQEDYYHVLESLDRPDDIHMVYINCAQILDDSGNRQDARKLILLACKHSPTHYTWYRAGLLYFQDNDLLSAEECFSEANFKDNRCPEYWGYLTIINLKLNRLSQAELCYSQALKNNLNDAMCEEIRKEFKKCST